jgi:hypothetical protein
MNTTIITIEIDPAFLARIIDVGFYLAVAFFAGFMAVIAIGFLVSLCKKKGGAK